MASWRAVDLHRLSARPTSIHPQAQTRIAHKLAPCEWPRQSWRVALVHSQGVLVEKHGSPASWLVSRMASSSDGGLGDAIGPGQCLQQGHGFVGKTEPVRCFMPKWYHSVIPMSRQQRGAIYPRPKPRGLSGLSPVRTYLRYGPPPKITTLREPTAPPAPRWKAHAFGSASCSRSRRCSHSLQEVSPLRRQLVVVARNDASRTISRSGYVPRSLGASSKVIIRFFIWNLRFSGRREPG